MNYYIGIDVKYFNLYIPYLEYTIDYNNNYLLKRKPAINQSIELGNHK